MSKKTKILMISDHAQTKTGVAVQTYHLIKGLLKTKKYSVVQLGAAVYHDDYSTTEIEEDFTIIPINGFGDKDTIRSMLVSYMPDVMIIFSDSRFFKHIFEMEDEIHQVCPIMWWHVWDNRPAPQFNKSLYNCIDTINCISPLTYTLCKELSISSTINYIPHTIPSELFYNLSSKEIKKYKEIILGKNNNDFVCTWVNRNIRRKRPGDVLKTWQIFLMNLEEKYNHKNAILLMHTDPYDKNGLNLVEIAKSLNILSNVRFSDQTVDFEKVNMLHNISDIHINIAYSEGFGLSTLEALSVGKPIVATQTGGLTRQLINKDTNFVHGIVLKPEITVLSGDQTVPYLNEDYVSVEKASAAIMSIYEWSKEKRRDVAKKCKEYIKESYSYEKMINKWDKSIDSTLNNWDKKYNRIRVEEIN